MEPDTTNSKWSLAARDGLILAAVTVVVSTLTFLTKNTFLSTLLWLVKLGGSIWLLSVIMKRYGKEHPDESTFSYGVIVCVFSAIVCAVWAFVEYQFLFPGAVAEAFEQMYTQFEQMGASLPDEVGDMAEFLMSSRGRFISGADFLIDGGCTASYWYGDLQYLKATH